MDAYLRFVVLAMSSYTVAILICIFCVPDGLNIAYSAGCLYIVLIYCFNQLHVCVISKRDFYLEVYTIFNRI